MAKQNPGSKPQTPPKKAPGGRNAYAYLQQPTNKQLHQETTAATNLAYGPVERATKANLRASNQRTKDVGNWWNEYLGAVGQSQAQTQQAYADAAAQTQGLINTGSAVDTANTAALNAEQAQAAAARGQDASAANAATTGTANAALSQRNTQIGTLGAAVAGQGANQYAYLANQHRIGAGQRVGAMTAEAHRAQSIRNDLASLAKERGEYAQKTLGQKESEQRELQLKRQAFGLEKKQANDAADAAAQSAQAEAKQKNLEYKQWLAEQELKEHELENETRKTNIEGYEARHPGPDSTSAATHKGLNNALAALNAIIKAAGGPPKNGGEWAELQGVLASESEISPSDAHRAIERYRKRHQNQLVTEDPNGASLGR